MKKVSILFIAVLLIIGCDAKGESTMTVSISSRTKDRLVYYSIKDISIADEQWGPFELDVPKVAHTITCFSGDTICIGAGSPQHTWGCGARGNISDFNKDIFCEKCETADVAFVLSDENANDETEELDDFDIVNDKDYAVDEDVCTDAIMSDADEIPDSDNA